MNNDTIITKNKLIELKDSNSIEFLVGFLAQLVFSNEIFKSNNELYSFVTKTFKIEFKQYVISSRTLIFSRLAKQLLTQCSEKDIINIKKNIINNIYEKLDELPSIEPTNKKRGKKSKNKNTTTESISKWIKGFQGD